MTKERRKRMFKPEENNFFKSFPGTDRFDFPKPLIRVTAGQGGEAILIIGSDKVAMYDTGMACHYEKLLSNIHEVLDPMGKTLDYIIMSHTHYDHIGAIPYLIEEFPNVVICGSPKAKEVFKSENAKKTIKRLGENARDMYKINVEIKTEPFRVDKCFSDEEELSLGDVTIKYYEAKGHTDCSCCYMILPQKIFLSSETLGNVEGLDVIATSPLKSSTETIESAKRLRNLDINTYIASHFGLVPKDKIEWVFDAYIKEAEFELDMITSMIKMGKTDQEISDEHDKYYWTEERDLNQPYAAYHLNTMIIIDRIRRGILEKKDNL